MTRNQREVEGGDHRFPLHPDHRGQRLPVDPAAQDRGGRQDLLGRVVQRLRPSSQGLDQAAAACPTHPRSTRSPPRRSAAPRPGLNQAIATVFLSIAVGATTLAPRRAAKAGWSAVRPRLASPTGH